LLLPIKNTDGSIAQWIERLPSKLVIKVRFLLGLHTTIFVPWLPVSRGIFFRYISPVLLSKHHEIQG
jgi:hypothetical protein